MEHCRGQDAPVNNLMVRSQRACSFQCPGCADFRWEPTGWPRFHGFSMIAKTFAPIPGIRSFTIMKCLLTSYARKKQ
jgi:hypothetical protein